MAPHKTRAKNSNMFGNFAASSARALGSVTAFIVAIGIVVMWAITGPLFHYSDTWQLVINTGTTVVTFLMVFLVQNTQNRDSAAIQLKLDELVRSTPRAHNAMLDLEQLSQDDIDKVRRLYERLGKKARQHREQGSADTGCPEVQAIVSPPAKKTGISF